MAAPLLADNRIPTRLPATVEQDPDLKAIAFCFDGPVSRLWGSARSYTARCSGRRVFSVPRRVAGVQHNDPLRPWHPPNLNALALISPLSYGRPPDLLC